MANQIPETETKRRANIIIDFGKAWPSQEKNITSDNSELTIKD